jgi:hypothetical protein
MALQAHDGAASQKGLDVNAVGRLEVNQPLRDART